jgi:L-threonylcarbamoyladenylate synthase
MQIVDKKKVLEERDKYQEIIRGVIKQGGIIAFPTDTVYGLAVDIFNEKALKKLYEAKKRPSNKLCPVQISDKSKLKNIVEDVSPSAEKLIDKFWPGALTVIFKAKHRFSKFICGEDLKIGVRIPNSDISLYVLLSYKNPLAVTSANISGNNILNSAEQIVEKFKNSVSFIIKDKIKLSGLPSTVIDVTSEPAKILREGAIRQEEIEKILKCKISN